MAISIEDDFSVRDRMRCCHVPGVAIAVIADGGVQELMYGTRAADSAAAVVPTTRFQAASISKPLASLAMLRLVDDGVLDLDRSIDGYLKSWRLPASPLGNLTLRQLASHSAGLSVSGFPGYPASGPWPSLVQILDGVGPANTEAVRIKWVPGRQFGYSGGGTVLMQLVLEDVTGERFEDVAARLVLGPLGMAHSSYCQPPTDDVESEAAIGHDETGRPINGGWHIYPEQAAAGLWTTAGDLARYARWLQQAGSQGDRLPLLKPATVEQMLTPQAPLDQEARIGGLNGMGIGPFLRATETGADYVGHSGGDAGYRCHLLVHRRVPQGAVIMTNGDGGYPLLVDLFDAIAKSEQWPDFPYSR